MLFSRLTRINLRSLILFALGALVLAIAIQPTAAQQSPKTLNELLDRAQIEDLLVDYYAQLGSGGHDYSTYYVEDGVLDVNGTIAQGKKSIEDLYKTASDGGPQQQGAFKMLLTNLKIVVNGTTATADVIWTGVRSETVKSVPQFVEQGREHDELVKRNGRWYFKHRVITSDGGLPPAFEKNYKPR